LNLFGCSEDISPDISPGPAAQTKPADTADGDSKVVKKYEPFSQSNYVEIWAKVKTAAGCVPNIDAIGNYTANTSRHLTFDHIF